MAQHDERTGVIGPFSNPVTQFASFRWAQSQHALLYGPSLTLGDRTLPGIAKGLFDWRATEQEMTKIRSGVTVGGRILGQARVGKGFGSVNKIYGSWMNSPFAVSKWTTSAQLMANPGGYTQQAGRLFAVDGFINGTKAARAEAGGSLPSTKRGIYNFEKHMPDQTRVAKANLSIFDSPADEEFARKWTSQALRFGPKNMKTNVQLGRFANKGLNFGTGMMFDVGEGFNPTRNKAFYNGIEALGYKQYSGSSKILQRLSAIEGKGAQIRYLGEGSSFMLSKFGRAAGGLAKFAGGALTAWAYFDMARMIGEGLYSVGELTMYTPAKRGFADMNRFATRPQFGQVGPQGWLQSPTAATNRARAVQAIQGSKLNARSALGNEASLLAGHFG